MSDQDECRRIAGMSTAELLQYVLDDPSLISDSYYRTLGGAIHDRAAELRERSNSYEFFVVMQKRGDGKVYPDLHKCLPHIFYNRDEAERAHAADPDLAQYRHVVRMLATLPEDPL